MLISQLKTVLQQREINNRAVKGEMEEVRDEESEIKEKLTRKKIK